MLALAGCATQADTQRVQRDTDSVRRVAADAQAMMEGAKRDIDALRGEVEKLQVQSGSGGALGDEVSDRLDRMEARLAAVESRLRGDVLLMDGGAETPGPQGVRVAIATALAAPGLPADFREGLSLLHNGNAEQSVPKFREFLRRSPSSELADDAQYWVGEAYLSIQDYNRAILELNDVLLRYPNGDRVPAALLRQSEAFKQLGDSVDAKLVLQKLVSDHSGTPEAEEGKKLLLLLSP